MHMHMHMHYTCTGTFVTERVEHIYRSCSPIYVIYT